MMGFFWLSAKFDYFRVLTNFGKKEKPKEFIKKKKIHNFFHKGVKYYLDE